VGWFAFPFVDDSVCSLAGNWTLFSAFTGLACTFSSCFGFLRDRLSSSSALRFAGRLSVLFVAPGRGSGGGCLVFARRPIDFDRGSKLFVLCCCLWSLDPRKSKYAWLGTYVEATGCRKPVMEIERRAHCATGMLAGLLNGADDIQGGTSFLGCCSYSTSYALPEQDCVWEQKMGVCGPCVCRSDRRTWSHFLAPTAWSIRMCVTFFDAPHRVRNGVKEVATQSCPNRDHLSRPTGERHANVVVCLTRTLLTFPRNIIDTSPTAAASPTSSPQTAPAGLPDLEDPKYDPEKPLPDPPSFTDPYQLTFGTVCGLVAGVFVKKGLRVVAFIMGGGFLLLQVCIQFAFPFSLPLSIIS
jgi:hypothetical protein